MRRKKSQKSEERQIEQNHMYIIQTHTKRKKKTQAEQNF